MRQLASVLKCAWILWFWLRFGCKQSKLRRVMKGVSIFRSQESHVSKREEYVCLWEREHTPSPIYFSSKFVENYYVCASSVTAFGRHKQEARKQNDSDNWLYWASTQAQGWRAYTACVGLQASGIAGAWSRTDQRHHLHRRPHQEHPCS